jgi:hypothetical protein
MAYSSEQKKVNVYVEIENKAPHLGIPLPKGKIRFYKADRRGGLQFIGEDEIDHTPKDETLRLYAGDSFDITGEHRRVEYKDPSKHLYEETFEIALRNHRGGPTHVCVTEHLWGQWEILSNSHDFTRRDAQTIEFPVDVPEDGEAVVRYTVRTKRD